MVKRSNSAPPLPPSTRLSMGWREDPPVPMSPGPPSAEELDSPRIVEASSCTLESSITTAAGVEVSPFAVASSPRTRASLHPRTSKERVKIPSSSAVPSRSISWSAPTERSATSAVLPGGRPTIRLRPFTRTPVRPITRAGLDMVNPG